MILQVSVSLWMKQRYYLSYRVIFYHGPLYSLDKNYMKGEDKRVEKGILSMASQSDLGLSWLGSEELANVLSPAL